MVSYGVIWCHVLNETCNIGSTNAFFTERLSEVSYGVIWCHMVSCAQRDVQHRLDQRLLHRAALGGGRRARRRLVERMTVCRIRMSWCVVTTTTRT